MPQLSSALRATQTASFQENTHHSSSGPQKNPANSIDGLTGSPRTWRGTLIERPTSRTVVRCCFWYATIFVKIHLCQTPVGESNRLARIGHVRTRLRSRMHHQNTQQQQGPKTLTSLNPKACCAVRQAQGQEMAGSRTDRRSWIVRPSARV